MTLTNFTDLQKSSLVVSQKKYIPQKLAINQKCIPFDEDESELKLAYCQSYPFDVINILSALSSKIIVPVLFNEEQIIKAIEACYQSSEKEAQALIERAKKNSSSLDENLEGHDVYDETESSSVIKIVNAIFLEAIKMGASDIHFEPTETGLVIRYRVDGVLIARHSPPKDIEAQIIARIKVLSQLDIAENRLPQDGRLKIRLNNRSVDFRVSVIPVAYGERIVLRVLDKSHLSLSLEKLGIPDDILQELLKAICIPEGMILVTGPTGSGKTTTLYSFLNKLLIDPINIMTIEDPVEFKFSGMAQMSVNPKINLSFSAGLKHILRQDPDVIMLGEIRDQQTAEIAIQASLTGHRVFSTLHTNDAPSAITRLVDMGIEPYLVCSSLTGVLAQRLMRKICPACRMKISMPPALKNRFPLVDHDVFYKGIGCDECFFTGYKGRIGIYEYLSITTSLKKQILKAQDSETLKEEALKLGFKDLYHQALELAKSGVTTLEEVISVTKISGV